MAKRIVIALGGNALGKNLHEQMDAVNVTAKAIADLIEEGYELVIAHGNGPQVGMIQNAFAAYRREDEKRDVMPLSMCVAMSQGYIGYDLQNLIGEELDRRETGLHIATVLTQVAVDPNDPAFQHPTKPIGAFYDKETADKIVAEKGYTFVEDAGRGYRRVVPSPKPVDVIEKNMVNALVEQGFVVITVGGGGIPVIRKDGKLIGTPAVIDKDFASAKLAELIHADALVILTAVDRVAINWGKPDQTSLDEMTIAQAEQYCTEGHFAPGSMLPKVKAAISFARTGGEAIIASLENAGAAVRGESGTRVHQ